VFSSLFIDTPPTDPYPLYEVLRGAGEPVLVADRMWAVTGYESCEHVLTDNRFVNDMEAVGLHKGGPQWREHSALRMLGAMMLMANPPRHGVLRRSLQRRFTPLRTAAETGMVTAVARDLAADLAERGDADFITYFADLLPTEVISRFIGIPESDRLEFRRQIVAFNAVFERGVTTEQLRAADGAADDLSAYIAELIAESGTGRKETLLAHIANAAADETLPAHEAVPLVFQIYNASYQTVSSLLGNGLAALLDHPLQLQALRERRTSLASAVTEMLRHDPPVQSTGRHAGTKLVLGGTAIEQGDMVVAMVAAANRDPAYFPRADEFLTHRTVRPLLSFGQGIHYCLGAPLATAQAEAAFAALLQFRSIELSGESHRRPSANMRGYASLPITVVR
jgi:cytochrome P450